MNGRSDRDAMRLLPGDVGLRGDRATFHLGPGSTQLIPLAKDGLPTGAVYYNMQPGAPAVVAVPGKGSRKNQKSQQLPQRQRKHVMQKFPSVPMSTELTFGPVTGMPINDDEHVFVFRLGKRHDEPDEKARLQIEMRLPKISCTSQTEVHTQVLATDAPTHLVEKNKGHGKHKVGGGKKAGGKKGGGKKTDVVVTGGEKRGKNKPTR